MTSDEPTLLEQLEAFFEAAFSIRVKHRFERRAWRRFFNHLSFQQDPVADRYRLSEGPVALWRHLDMFRNRGIQLAAFEALGLGRHSPSPLSNLMVPVDIRSDHRGLTQQMFDSALRGFLFERYATLRMSLPDIHRELATLLLNSMISDRVIVVETDFSHESNMAIKYIIRPFETKPIRTLPIDSNSNLYFSPNIAISSKLDIHISIQSDMSSIFNKSVGNSGFLDNEELDRSVVGPNPEAGYLVFARQTGDYSFAYILPLYGLINRSSDVVTRSAALFATISAILANEGRERIDRNKHHSRLRHTIGVEVSHLSLSFSEIFEARQLIVRGLGSEAEHMNVLLAQINSSIHDLSRDIKNQFEIEFDFLGNRRDGRTAFDDLGVVLNPEGFRHLVREVGDTARGKRQSVIAYDFLHTGPMAVASEPALRNSLTEIFNNAIKYNVVNEIIRVRTRQRGDDVSFSISNIGPALSEEEAAEVPLMGLRGINSQRQVVAGSGQGLATVFSILKDIEVSPEYRTRPLSKDQSDRLGAAVGSRHLRELDLANHIVELTFASKL